VEHSRIGSQPTPRFSLKQVRSSPVCQRPAASSLPKAVKDQNSLTNSFLQTVSNGCNYSFFTSLPLCNSRPRPIHNPRHLTT
jgi:hypothetical protein